MPNHREEYCEACEFEVATHLVTLLTERATMVSFETCVGCIPADDPLAVVTPLRPTAASILPGQIALAL